MRGAVPLALFGPTGYGEVLWHAGNALPALAAYRPAAFALLVRALRLLVAARERPCSVAPVYARCWGWG